MWTQEKGKWLGGKRSILRSTLRDWRLIAHHLLSALRLSAGWRLPHHWTALELMHSLTSRASATVFYSNSGAPLPDQPAVLVQLLRLADWLEVPTAVDAAVAKLAALR